MNVQPRLFLLLLLAGCAGGAPPSLPSSVSTLQDLPVEALAADLGAALADGDAPRLPALAVQAKSYRPFHLEFRTADACAGFAVPETHVLGRFEKWADVLVPTTGPAFNQMARFPGLLWVEGGYAAIVPPQPPIAPEATRGTQEVTARGGLQGLKGKGVVVAIVDSGLDFRHPDFITMGADGKPVSRLLAFWDTTGDLFAKKKIGGAAPVTWPDGTSFGTVFTREQLTAELRASARTIGSLDANGHGTACGSIAAGNGRGHSDPTFAGVAPEAELIAVRVGGSSGRGLENSFLLGPIAGWIEATSGGRPFVMSCSLGGQSGGRDGQRVLERQLSGRFASTAKGRALCIAAGNEGDRGLHAGAVLGPADKPARIEWEVHPGTVGQVTLYFGSKIGADLFFKTVGTTPANVTQFTATLNPFTQDISVQLAVTSAGSYALDLWSASGTAVPVDAYMAWNAVGGAAGTIIKPVRFTGATAVAGKQIATPGAAAQAVTVGSYDFNGAMETKKGKGTWGVNGKPLTIGALSSYSNPGPARVGEAVKPELVAPGQFHLCALAEGTTPPYPIETTGRYWYMNGTSAATPYAAGVIALMLQKNPDLTVGEIRELLVANLSRDAFTGTLPNPGWGRGKLDLKAVRAVLAAVKAK
ncbi:MAG TPA: S8 family serine peptidase [Planctomycetota bacterium]